MKRKHIFHYFEEVGTIEEYTKKEILSIISDYLDNIESLEDENIFILYDDEKFFHLIGKEQFGNTKFRKNGIKKVIIDNGSTFQTWGKYHYKIEDGCLFVE